MKPPRRSEPGRPLGGYLVWPLLLLAGCEADPSEAADAASDVGADVASDQPLDVPAARPDAGADASPDVPRDTAPDAPLDAPLDAPTDASLDVPTDAPLDAPLDAPTDASLDVPTDAPADVPTVDVPCTTRCAPRPVWPGSASVVSSHRPLLRWALAPETDGAQVELSRDRTFATGVVTLTATGTTTSPSADLAPGAWHWRLRGRSAGVSGTAASAPWMFVVGSRSAALSSVVGSTPDFNADGHADLVVGAVGSTGAWVFLGGSTGFASAPSFIGPSVPSLEVSLERTLSAAGDLNGDGYPDVLGLSGAGVLMFGGGVAGLSASPTVALPPGVVDVAGVGDVNGDGYADAVATRVVTGSNYSVSLHLGGAAGLSTAAAQTWTGGLNLFDSQVRGRAAGDVNGDGYADVIVSSLSTGEVRIYHGGATLPTTPSATLTPTSTAPVFNAAGAGDLNGDGYGDVFVAIVSNGGTLVYYGSATGLGSSSASIATSSWRLPRAAGDLNGDGFDDLAFDNTDPSTAGSSVAVHLGGASGVARTVSQTLSGAARSLFGYGVAGLGDVDGDGYHDLAVGEATLSGVAAGRVNLHRGGATGVATAFTNRLADPTEATFGTSLAPSPSGFLVTSLGAMHACSGTACTRIEGGLLPGAFGSATVATGTDPFRFNAVVGAPGSDRAFAYLQSASASSVVTLVGPSATSFGAALGVGDVDNDHFRDVVVGAPDGDRAFVYPDGLAGLSTTPSTTLSGPTGSRFGRGLAVVGDVNADGFEDLVVGAPMADRAYLYLGAASGLPTTPTATLTGPAGSRFGSAVVGVGDLNSDGRAEVLIGAPGADQAYLYLGAAGGFAATPVTLAGPAGSQFGASLAGSRSAGLLVGAPGAGRAYVHRADPASATLLATLTGSGHFGSAVVFDSLGAAIVASDAGAVTRYVPPAGGFGASDGSAPVATAVSGVNAAFGARMVTRLP